VGSSGFFSHPGALRFSHEAGKLNSRLSTTMIDSKQPDSSTPNPAFMRRAIAIALENVRNGGGPFGSVITRDGRIVAEGVNRVTATNDPTAHAEIVAIRAACASFATFQLDNCDLYTTCEPCPMCLGAIYWARPARVFFASSAGDAAAAGFDDAFIYDELYLPFAAREIPMTQLLREESLAIFTAWKHSELKTEY
jgi:guanine deaminase